MLKFLLSILLVQLCASKLTLTLTRVSTKELHGIFFDPETAVGLIFKSTKNSLSLVNANGKSLLEYGPVVADPQSREDFSLNVLGSYLPANATAIDDILENYIESEAKYLPELYYAMAELQISGVDMPSAMGVYSMALGYNKFQQRFGKDKLAPCTCDCPAAINIAECHLSKDVHGPPQCCDCLGQCGACGSCWTWVCSSCCWRLGCCGHDICCYTRSGSCMFPVGLSCDKEYTCSEHSTSCCKNAPRNRMDTCPTASFGCECNKNQCCAGGKWDSC